MAETDFDAEKTAVSEKRSLSPRQKKRAAAIIAAGVTVFLLGAVGWVFLFPHQKIPAHANLAPLPFPEIDGKLLQAVRDDDAGEVARLLNMGADFSAKDSFGVSAMKGAIALNRLDIVRQFLEAKGGSSLIRKDNSLLVYAVVQNRAEIVREFLKLGLDIDKVDKNGYTPLMYAIDRNLAEIARALLKAGAGANRIDRYGQTPLIQAVTVGSPDMISLLLESGADPRIVSPGGETAMSIAQRKNRNVVISLLINAGSPLFY
ncbi:MAG: ankyrin repeat domain-containing protein [Synergistaceae bacterium]|jgi:ankyrin repeat protein|nr:ankyrin repeat domain-containing protein [Synergistaceae bacterium]